MSKAFDSEKIKNAFAKFKEKADDTYNAKLVSGTNIKTINTQSILGSGDLHVGDVTEVNTEIVRITDLDTGVYRLTWGATDPGSAHPTKIAYNGLYSNSTVNIATSWSDTEFILYVTKLNMAVSGGGYTSSWEWCVITSQSGYHLCLLMGSTTTSSGSYTYKRLDQLLDSNNIANYFTYATLSSDKVPGYSAFQQAVTTGYIDTTTRTSGTDISGTNLYSYMSNKLPVTINGIKYTYQNTDSSGNIHYSAIFKDIINEEWGTVYYAMLDNNSNQLYLNNQQLVNVYFVEIDTGNSNIINNDNTNLLPPQFMVFDISSDISYLFTHPDRLYNLDIIFSVRFEYQLLSTFNQITFLGAWQGYSMSGDDTVPFTDFGELEIGYFKYQVFILGTDLYFISKNFPFVYPGASLPALNTIALPTWCYIDPNSNNSANPVLSTYINELSLLMAGTTFYNVTVSPKQTTTMKLPITGYDEDVDRMVSFDYSIGDTEITQDSNCYPFTITLNIEKPLPPRITLARNLVVNLNNAQYRIDNARWTGDNTSNTRTFQVKDNGSWVTADLSEIKALLRHLTGSTIYDMYDANYPTPCFVYCTYDNICWKLQYDGLANGLVAYKTKLPFEVAKTAETFTVASADWVSDGNISPFDYKVTLTATQTIGANTIVELVNDNAVNFATYGFSIGDVTGQVITIYSIGQPSASITFTVRIGN